MSSSRIIRRTVIALVAAGYYFTVVYLTGLSTKLTSMAQFFGHALIYAAGVALISSILFIVERSSSKRREEEFCAEAVKQSQRHGEEAYKSSLPMAASVTPAAIAPVAPPSSAADR